jgi:hypothetical protein
MLVGNSYYNHKRIHQITFESTQYTSIIDYILIPRELKSKFRDVKVIRGAELSTDHHLLVADTIFPRERRRRRTTFQRIKHEKLKNEQTREHYQRLLEAKLNEPLIEQEDMEDKWRRLKGAVLAAAEETCGLKTVREGMKSTRWWNEREVALAVREKKEAWREWKRSRSQTTRETYITKRNVCKEVVKRAKAESWERLGEELENNYRSDDKKFWKFLRSQRGKFGKKVRSVKNGENQLKVETEEVLEVWRQFYEDKFRGNLQEALQGQEGENEEDGVGDGGRIERQEVERAIARMRNGKAAGEDAIVPEMIKEGGRIAVEAITDLFDAVWRAGRTPDDWRKSVIIPIYKKGDTTRCESYRAVCLIDVIAKLYSSVLEQKLRRYVEDDLDEEQAGFRPGRQTQDLIFSIRMITDKWISRGQKAYLAFLDLRAAFDEVPREEIWKALTAKQIPGKLVRAIKAMFCRPMGMVRLDGRTSQPFQMEKGVRQGDSLSPLLFVIFMDEVIKTCRRRTERSLVGMRCLRPVQCQAMIYADDILLIADSCRKLQQAVTEWSETLKERGMTVNKAKSQVMVVARTEEQVEEIAITCDGVGLTQVSNYEYLGTTIHQTGKLREEIRNRVKKASNAYYAMGRCIFGKNEIARQTKVRVYTAIVEPILLYGSESWVANKNEFSLINSVQMKCCRRIAGKTRRDRIRNDRIRELVNLPPISQRMEDRQLSWYGHVVRMHEERKPRLYMEARAQGRRPIGRPRTTWEEKLTQTAASREKTMGQLRRLAIVDRRKFKEWIRGGPPTLR